MSIRIQLSTENSIVSGAIRMWTRGPYSHVDIFRGTDLLGARSNGGVQIRPPDYANFTAKMVIEFPCTYTNEMLFFDFLDRQIGKPYDHTALAGLVLNRDWRNPDKWFCSELFQAAAEYAYIVKKLTTPVAFISPRDVMIEGELLGTVISAS